MPQLFIIAGPNGAGKSLFSKDLVSVDYPVFDGDKHITALKQQFPETGSDVLETFVNDHTFKEAKQRAINENKSFAFETNFSSDDPLLSQREFQKAGYSTHLIFIGLETLEESSTRVKIRVKTGGHKVPDSAIAYNFEHGYNNLLKCYHAFDSVELLANPVSEVEGENTLQECVRWENKVLDILNDQLPTWVEKFLTHLRQNQTLEASTRSSITKNPRQILSAKKSNLKRRR